MVPYMILFSKNKINFTKNNINVSYMMPICVKLPVSAFFWLKKFDGVFWNCGEQSEYELDVWSHQEFVQE